MRGKSGIYVITHKASGKQYIGQSQSIGDRWLWHKSALRRGAHSNRLLMNAWRKYGEVAFSFRVLEYCEPTDSALCAAEQRWIDRLSPAYNLAPVAGTSRGTKHPPRSKAFREKMSEMKKGYKPSPETIELLRRRQRENPWTPPPEHIEKLRRIHTGRKLSPERIEKMRDAALGKKQSPETIAKRVAKLRGRVCSEETKRKIGEANSKRLTGTKQSAELIEKRIAPLRGRKRPPEVIAALHAALRASREAQDEPLREIIAANLHLTVTELCPLVGRSFKPTSRLKKEVLARLAQQSASESAASASPPNKARTSTSRSVPLPPQSLPFG